MPFDVIIIGSGFGGAITACRLSQAGYKVLVLERGRRWDKSNFPRKPEDPWLWNHDRPETENGWLDLRMFPGMSVAAGAAVGGGSLIYANISCEAPAAVFDQGWCPEITYQELKPHYDAVADVMDVQPVPDGQWTGRMKLMRDAAQAAGYGDRFEKLDLAVSFDKNWTYESDYAKGEQGSTPFTNKHGTPKGRASIWAIAISAAMFWPRTRWTATTCTSPRISAMPTCARCNWSTGSSRWPTEVTACGTTAWKTERGFQARRPRGS